MQYAVGGLKKFQNSGPPNESYWISYHDLQKKRLNEHEVHQMIMRSSPKKLTRDSRQLQNPQEI